VLMPVSVSVSIESQPRKRQGGKPPPRTVGKAREERMEALQACWLHEGVEAVQVGRAGGLLSWILTRPPSEI
jgi:hypothetical protein